MTADPDVEYELQELAARYGEPLRREGLLGDVDLFDPIDKRDRYGEVCMVIRRPDGRLITAIKTFYPAGAYRLLTGGIHHGERILDALLRETAEETGLDVVVRQFLAAISYGQPGRQGQPMLFRTFAFLLEEIGGTLQCLDPAERLAEFRPIAVEALPALADHLDRLPDEVSMEIGGSWRAWGSFRAVVHRAVYEALAGAAS
jgi:8-oxo-dGTP pyrophosphatase MutT (NUDIX family)